jgi:hypothetical protein
MGDSVAFVLYDHGIRGEIDSFPINNLIKFKLQFKTPNENGLPTGEENEVSDHIDDDIGSFVEEHGGIFVGRITVDGARYFYCYVQAPKEIIDGFLEGVQQKHGYRIVVHEMADPSKDGYWKDLFPTEDDWQMIQDLRVVRVLEEHGDTLEVPRKIDHWIYFESMDELKRFLEWVKSEEFVAEEITEPNLDQNSFGLHIYRTDVPELFKINRVTQMLRHKAKQYGGDYDGWETSIEQTGA